MLQLLRLMLLCLIHLLVLVLLVLLLLPSSAAALQLSSFLLTPLPLLQPSVAPLLVFIIWIDGRAFARVRC